MFSRDFIRLLEESVGERAPGVLEALEREASVSLRLNPAKLVTCPFEGAEPIGWSPYGYLLSERPNFTLDPLFHAGGYYVQDSSAMFVGTLLRRILGEFQPGVRVLDLCAAPGGKTTDAAASLRGAFGERFSLIANEVMRKRFATLRSNLRSWGDGRVGVVCRDPAGFGNEPLFDIILADVPCSGEGMFRKDAKAIEDWSMDTVRLCAARSRRILSDIWPTLREGGVLIYSTCTFNHIENDDTALWIAESLGAELMDLGEIAPALRTRAGYAMLPGLVPGEGQWATVLRKKGNGITVGDPFRTLKAEIPAEAIPDYPRVELGRADALKYLHGDALRLDGAPMGTIVMTYMGLPLGLAKNLGSRCNNLYPKDRRIRMDV